MRQKGWAKIFVIYLRYLIGGAFVFSSIVKIQGGRFTTNSGADSPIDSAWHFFETLYQSGLYWKFLGAGQLISGLLLMTQRYAALGAVMFFPITVNIFVITISYNFAGTPFITGLLMLANIFLLVWDYEKLLPLLQYKADIDNDIANAGAIKLNDNSWIYTGLVLFLITIVYVLLYGRNPLWWFVICTAAGLGGLIFYGVSKKQKKKI